jgi:hypothetical protein
VTLLLAARDRVQPRLVALGVTPPLDHHLAEALTLLLEDAAAGEVNPLMPATSEAVMGVARAVLATEGI